MRLLLIVNTSASFVTARARVVIHKALSADHDVVLKETNRRGHAARLAQGAAADGLDAAVVLGGDGTLNEAANGLAGSPTALGVLPGGSTNVFARTLGMANDPIEATSQLLGALAAGSVKRVGLGRAERALFSVPCRHRFRRRSGAPGRGNGVAQALLRARSVRRGDAVDMGEGLRPAPAGVLAVGGRDPGRRRLLQRMPEHRPLYLPRQPAFAPRARDVSATTLSVVTFQTLSLRTMIPVLVSALAKATRAAAPARVP